MLDSASRDKPLAHEAGTAFADAVDFLEIVETRGEQLLERPEMVDEAVDDGPGRGGTLAGDNRGD